MAKTTNDLYRRGNASGPRKRRTRQHVIADQSVNQVERFIIDEGHTTLRVEKGYVYDLILCTYDEQGYVEPGVTCLQLKAAESLQAVGTGYPFDLDIRDYNLWMLEEFPVILILFDASRRRAYWLDIHRYFRDDPSRRPERGRKSIRVHVPARQVVNRRAIAKMRALKWERRAQLMGEYS